MNNHHVLSPQQIEYFRQKLLVMRQDVIAQAQRMLENLQQETHQQDPDAEFQREAMWLTESSLLTHEQHLLNSIDAALDRINDGTYGECQETGEPIPLERLEAYPMATLSLEAQQEQERNRRIFSVNYRPMYRP